MIFNFKTFQYKLILNHFQKTSSLLSPASHAASFLVPSRGWFIYGGYLSASPNSQHLQSLSGTWETGPRLYEVDSHLCSVQVLCVHWNQ
jgi:hypothetical protein